jgi:organic hydroperoxide reductase OsmC/OhrA
VPHAHHYTTTVTWQGSTAEGYERYDRHHAAMAPPATTTLALTSDPAFGGDPSLLNPEALLVVSASSCQLLSFLAVAARARVDVVAYRDDAEAEMPEDNKPMRITRIVLRPHIAVRGVHPLDKIERLVRIGHDECFIANSLSSEVVVEPVITFED